jgi:hypothetical protein
MSPTLSTSTRQKAKQDWTILEQFLPNEHVVTECPVSTPDGVKAIDVAWLAPERGQEADTETCLTRAPGNLRRDTLSFQHRRRVDEKVALYFEAGAREVWICERDGTLKFHFSSPHVLNGPSSRLGHPLKLELHCGAYPISPDYLIILQYACRIIFVSVYLFTA